MMEDESNTELSSSYTEGGISFETASAYLALKTEKTGTNKFGVETYILSTCLRGHR